MNLKREVKKFMKGLELSKKFYNEFGDKMLKESFADILNFLAVGLVGSGSECMGFDDEISHDHDFEPGFCIFVPDEIDEKTFFELERAYSKLPREFLGFKRNIMPFSEERRHGVIKVGDFYEQKTGSRDGLLSLGQWLSTPEFALLEAVNGEVFFDNLGKFSNIRENLRYYPEDIWRKKLAGNLFLMSQSGLYNFERCLKRGDSAACQLSLFEFVKSAINVCFILNQKYMPYYKWAFRALKNSERLANLAESFEFLISNGNEGQNAERKLEIIAFVCSEISKEISAKGIVKNNCSDIQKLANLVNNSIEDISLRNLNVLSAV